MRVLGESPPTLLTLGPSHPERGLEGTIPQEGNLVGVGQRTQQRQIRLWFQPYPGTIQKEPTLQSCPEGVESWGCSHMDVVP